MSQYGMQMPGGRANRGPSLGVIDALLLLSVVAMGFACVFMYQAAAEVSPDGQPWKVQEPGNVRLSAR
ncbi:MAG: hypothetical protein KatS3mg103_0730 [Phycisphaerales bacterium]|nr:MAG: hypothetical protein KatS3mg103_0730 [Phycisphaerales bacterium]